MPPPVASTISSLRASNCRQRGLLHAPKTFLAVERDDLGDRQAVLASISLFSSTKLQPIFFASILPSVDLPAPRRPIRAMPANDIRRCAEAPLARENILGLRDLVRRRLAQEVADDRPVRRRFGRSE